MPLKENSIKRCEKAVITEKRGRGQLQHSGELGWVMCYVPSCRQMGELSAHLPWLNISQDGVPKKFLCGSF